MRPIIILTVVFALGFASATRSPVGASSPDDKPRLVLNTPPAASVDSVTVSPDGSLVAAGAGEGGVRIYDAKTGAPVRAIADAGDRGVAFAPDGRTLAAAGFHMEKAFMSPLLTLPVFDVQTGQRVQTLVGHTEWEIDAIAFSPDGKLFASIGTDKQLLVWDRATGTIRFRLPDQPSRVPALAFSPDSTTLAAGGDRTVRLWDVTTGRLRQTLAGHRNWVCTVAFSPDGKTIASGDCDWAYHRGRNTAFFDRRDPGCGSQWKLWDAATGALKRSVTESGRMLSLAVAPDGRSLACGVGKDVRLYDLRTEAPGCVVTGHHFDVTSVAYTPDSTAVISGSHDHTVKRVAVATGRVEWHAPGYYEQVNSVALSADGTLLATGSSDGRFAVRVVKAGAPGVGPGAVRLWDPRTGRLLRRLGDPNEQIMAVALSPDGRKVAAGGASQAGSGIVRVWDASNGAVVWSKDDHTAEVLASAYAPDGSTLATAGADGLVKLHDPQNGAVTRTLAGHDGGANSLAFSADSATLVCGDGRGAVRIWEVKTGRLLHTCRAAGSQASTVTTDRLFTPVALTPDGGTVVACPATMGNTFGEPVRFWEVRTGELKRGFDGPAHSARPIALSPDGTILAAGGKSIRLLDARTGQLLRELSGHLKKTQSILFSADGRLLFAGGSYGTTNAWEIASGRHLVTLFAFPENRDGTIADDWLAYHPDGFYDGSPGIERYLAWRVGADLQTADQLEPSRRRPEFLEAALQPSR
jgi:WD40 repeat protein